MGRAPCCDKSKVKKGPWSREEDARLKGYMEKNGTGGNWIALPHKADLNRCGKSCRLRWLNYLRPEIKHGDFSEDEDRVICNLFSNIGSRWSVIAAQMPGRTDNDVKNYWNTRLKKKLKTALPNTSPSQTPKLCLACESFTPLVHPSTFPSPSLPYSVPPFSSHSYNSQKHHHLAGLNNHQVELDGYVDMLGPGGVPRGIFVESDVMEEIARTVPFEDYYTVMEDIKPMNISNALDFNENKEAIVFGQGSTFCTSDNGY